MKNLLLTLVLSAAIGCMAACAPVVEEKSDPQEQERFAQCVAKGLTYLRDIEHFPYLDDNTVDSNLVTNHVGQLCNKNSGSFGPLNGPTVLPSETQNIITR